MDVCRLRPARRSSRVIVCLNFNTVSFGSPHTAASDSLSRADYHPPRCPSLDLLLNSRPFTVQNNSARNNWLTRSVYLYPFAFTILALAGSITAQDAFAQRASHSTSPKITEALQPFVDSQALAGAVTLVADKDKFLSVDTVGFTDVAAKKAMPADALFWIASQSKPVTGAALMILVDEGKVDLNAPVSKYLPEFNNTWVTAYRDNDTVLLKRPTRQITVRDCMNHTSGMPFKSDLEQPTLDLLPLRDGIRSYALTPLNSEPGTKYAYSNAGINTGGRIIEVVSGLKYEDFLDQRLFVPLGMTDTTFWPNEEQLTRLAKPYKPTADKRGLEETTISQLRYPLNDRTRQPMPGGGLFSTASDMGRFCQMVLNRGTLDGKRILSEAAVATMTSKQTAESIKDGYGVGWSTQGESFGHGGALATNHNIDTKRGLITIFLVQHAGFPKNGNESQGAFRKAAEAQFGLAP